MRALAGEERWSERGVNGEGFPVRVCLMSYRTGRPSVGWWADSSLGHWLSSVDGGGRSLIPAPRVGRVLSAAGFVGNIAEPLRFHLIDAGLGAQRDPVRWCRA
jgi:hypothetical protein